MRFESRFGGASSDPAAAPPASQIPSFVRDALAVAPAAPLNPNFSNVVVARRPTCLECWRLRDIASERPINALDSTVPLYNFAPAYLGCVRADSKSRRQTGPSCRRWRHAPQTV